MTTIYLIRHGEAEGNAFRRIHGQYDSNLTPTGREQAKYVAKRFESVPLDAVLSSDLTRAASTAAPLARAHGLPLRLDPAFREVGIGIWEDVPFGALEKEQPEAMTAFHFDPIHWQVDGSESFWDYTNRFIHGMTKWAQTYPGGSIAIFCHSVILRGLMLRLFFMDHIQEIPYCENTSVSKLFYENGTFSYEYLNNADHVPQRLSTYAKQKWWRDQGLNKRDFNLWYRPGPEEDGLICVHAMRREEAVGLVRVDPAAGRLVELRLREDCQGKFMDDQLLGHAVSLLRCRGFETMGIDPAILPEPDLARRYGFEHGLLDLRVRVTE